MITNEGELYMFGRGREGQLGRADKIESTVTPRLTPQRVDSFQNKRVVSVACGGYHSLALIE
jgi:alpha-tubulin suppressor-like RCC1 family protein